MKKALLISNVTNRFTNFIIPSIEVLNEMGYEVYTCANYTNFNDDKDKYSVKMHHIDFQRNPFNLKNIRAYKQLLKLMKDEKFDIVHYNTPIGGLLGRICAKKAKVPKVIYTAHGFHFFEGNNKMKNFIYKTIEKWLAKYTDAIITINEEDYQAAQKFKLRNDGSVYKVNGVGIDISEFENVNIDIRKKREELGIKESDKVLISIGDVNKNKNTDLLIDIIYKCNNKNLKCLICGKGDQIEILKHKICNLKLESQILFLGFRNDIKELLKVSYIYISTSKREGLPRALMEAMASGLPCVVSNIRGNRDLIENDKNGYCCNKIEEYVDAINSLIESEDKTYEFTKKNLEVIKNYDFKKVKNEIRVIYNELDGNKEI